MRFYILSTFFISLPITVQAQVSKLQFEASYPFEALRSFLPKDGEVVEVDRKRDVWPEHKGQGEDRTDEWVQLALGRIIRADPDRRREDKDFGPGLVCRDGKLFIRAGWRARKKLPGGDYFDGTFTATASIRSAGGNIIVDLSDIDVEWEGGIFVDFAKKVLGIESRIASLIKSNESKFSDAINSKLQSSINAFSPKDPEVERLLQAVSVYLAADRLHVSLRSYRNGGVVQLWQDHGGFNQRWVIDGDLKDGKPKVINAVGSFFGLEAHQPDVGKNGCRIQTWINPRSAHQLWKLNFVKTDGGVDFFEIENVASGKLLDAAFHAADRNGCPVQLYDRLGKPDNQLWSFEKNQDGSYKITNKKFRALLDIQIP